MLPGKGIIEFYKQLCKNDGWFGKIHFLVKIHEKILFLRLALGLSNVCQRFADHSQRSTDIGLWYMSQQSGIEYIFHLSKFSLCNSHEHKSYLGNSSCNQIQN